MKILSLIPAPRRLLILFASVILPLLIAGNIAEDLLEHERFTFEQPLMMWLHQHTTPLMIQVSLVLNIIGKMPYAALLALLLAGWQWHRHRASRAVFILLGTLLSASIMSVAKYFFNRPRPQFWPRIAEAAHTSFPSGHSTYAATLATLIIILYWHTPQRWPLTAAALLFAFCMGLSRIILGVHYPTDVVVGWITGSVTVILLQQVMRRDWSQRKLS